MTNVEIIDYATNKTLGRWNNKISDEHNYKNVAHALQLIIEKQNYQSITSLDGARDEIKQISIVELEAELLKNLVGSIAYKRAIGDNQVHGGVSLLDLNTVQDNTPDYQIENGLYESIREFSMMINTQEKYGLERGQIGFEWLNHNSIILNTAINLFVEDRYIKNLSDKIDNFVVNDNGTKEVIDVINNYCAGTLSNKHQR